MVSKDIKQTSQVRIVYLSSRLLLIISQRKKGKSAEMDVPKPAYFLLLCNTQAL